MPILNKLEIITNLNCNLNCLNCNMDAYKNPSQYYDPYKLLIDLIKLKKVIPHIKHISVLGGEPLLHNDLLTIIYNVKKIYNPELFDVMTNGILLTSDLVKTLNFCGVRIRINYYKWSNLNLEYVMNYVLKSSNFSLKIYNEEFKSFDGVSKGVCSFFGKCICLFNGKLYGCWRPIPSHPEDGLNILELSPSLFDDYINNTTCLNSCKFCAGDYYKQT